MANFAIVHRTIDRNIDFTKCCQYCAYSKELKDSWEDIFCKLRNARMDNCSTCIKFKKKKEQEVGK